MNYLYKSVGVIALILGCLSLGQTSFAQYNYGPAIEQWRSFLPYFQVNDLAISNDLSTIYCGTDYGFFTYNRDDGSLDAYSKVNGMHDLNLSGVAYDANTGAVVLAYKNGNLDIFHDNHFSNIPDLKITGVTGDKTIYNITADQGKAFLSTGLGLVVINIQKEEISYTVPFFSGSLTARVNDAVVANNQIYVATEVGLYTTDLNNNLIQNYATWDLIDSKAYTGITINGNDVYAIKKDSLFMGQDNAQPLHFASLLRGNAIKVNESPRGVWVSSLVDSTGIGYGLLYDQIGQLLDSVPAYNPSSIIEITPSEIWYGDHSSYLFPEFNGLRKKLSATESESYTPDGPISAASYDISAYNGQIWVAHGGYTGSWLPARNGQNFSVFRKGEWRNFHWLSNNEWVRDFVEVNYDPKTRHAFVSSLTGGLVDVDPDFNFTVYNQGFLPEMYANPGLYSASGSVIDDRGNLWITSNMGSPELTMRTPDNQWIPMKIIGSNGNTAPPHTAANPIIDDYGQIWFMPTIANGIVVYNPNNTPENPNDDQYRQLRTGQGNGNLPNNQVNCLAKTKDGSIWVGTADGIGIINCPGQVIAHQCETSLTPVATDEFAGDWLFVRQAVNAIAVDAANRKWVGTDNGVWLISTDNGIKTIYRFTEENSPLPSNKIRRINIDPVTGDVYFSTEDGFVSFRSTATEVINPPKQSDIFIYPNPVPAGYHGMIAVKGLPEGADVRFTDITGKMAYRTKALGGQAVWNGNDYTGHKVQSGVYLVFVVSKDGQQKMTSKLIIQK